MSRPVSLPVDSTFFCNWLSPRSGGHLPTMRACSHRNACVGLPLTGFAVWRSERALDPSASRYRAEMHETCNAESHVFEQRIELTFAQDVPIQRCAIARCE
jgi:hypothetical protein